MNQDKHKWSDLVKIYQGLNPSLRKKVAEKYLKFTMIDNLTTSLQRALTEEGLILPPDMAKEYHDILAEQAAFEALREED